MIYYKGNCSAELMSETAAIRAQKLLSGLAIQSSIIHVGQSSSRRGCAYGIAFDCNQRANVERVLRNAGIGVKKWNTAD